MKLFERLFAKHPSAGWPRGSGPAPSLDLDRATVGPMRLGDPLEAARPFGRPVNVSAGAAGETLEYDGFQLEMQDGKLICAAFDLDHRERVVVGTFELTADTTPVDVQVYLGDPSSDTSSNDGLRWIDYERGEATLALEFDEGKLAYVQLYAEGYA